MKRILLLAAFTALVCYVHSQVVYNRPDYVFPGDEIPVVTYSNSNSETGMLISDFQTEENTWLFSNFTFDQFTTDVLSFPLPSVYDENGDFTDATLATINDMGFAEFRKITWSISKIIGLRGEIPMTGAIVSIFATDPLEIMHFPTASGDEHADIGIFNRTLPISAFHDIIPADYYQIVAMMYDSIKIHLEIELYSSFEENTVITIEHEQAYNATRNVLKEKRGETRSTNIFIRSLTGTYYQLNEAPVIGSQVPVELPMTDSTHHINFWAYSLGIPIVSIETDILFNQAKTVQIYNGETLNVDVASSSGWSIYPNPTSGITTFTNNEAKFSNIKILSVDGKLILDDNFYSNIYIFDTQNLPQGLYLYQISNKSDSIIETGRLQVIR